jgi:hypothetical protein
MMCRGENSCPYQDSNSDPLVIQPIASHYTDCALPAPKWVDKFDLMIILLSQRIVSCCLFSEEVFCVCFGSILYVVGTFTPMVRDL